MSLEKNKVREYVRRKYNANPAIYSKYKAKIGKNLNFY